MKNLVMLSLSFLVIFPNTVDAQSSLSEEVLLAAVEHLRKEVLPEGSLRMHPEFLVADPDIILGEAVPQEFVLRAGADGFMRLDDAMHCVGHDTSSCTLKDGAAAVLALSRPDVRTEDLATVLAKTTYRTGLEDRPLAGRTFVLHLERRSEEWVVVRVEVRRAT